MLHFVNSAKLPKNETFSGSQSTAWLETNWMSEREAPWVTSPLTEDTLSHPHTSSFYCTRRCFMLLYVHGVLYNLRCTLGVVKPCWAQVTNISVEVNFHVDQDGLKLKRPICLGSRVLGLKECSNWRNEAAVRSLASWTTDLSLIPRPAWRREPTPSSFPDLHMYIGKINIFFLKHWMFLKRNIWTSYIHTRVQGIKETEI